MDTDSLIKLNLHLYYNRVLNLTKKERYSLHGDGILLSDLDDDLPVNLSKNILNSFHLLSCNQNMT